MDGVIENPPNSTLALVAVKLGKNQRLNDFPLSDAGLPSASAESLLLLVLQTPSVARLDFADSPC